MRRLGRLAFIILWDGLLWAVLSTLLVCGLHLVLHTMGAARDLLEELKSKHRHGNLRKSPRGHPRL